MEDAGIADPQPSGSGPISKDGKTDSSVLTPIPAGFEREQLEDKPFCWLDHIELEAELVRELPGYGKWLLTPRDPEKHPGFPNVVNLHEEFGLTDEEIEKKVQQYWNTYRNRLARHRVKARRKAAKTAKASQEAAADKANTSVPNSASERSKLFVKPVKSSSKVDPAAWRPNTQAKRSNLPPLREAFDAFEMPTEEEVRISNAGVSGSPTAGVVFVGRKGGKSAKTNSTPKAERIRKWSQQFSANKSTERVAKQRNTGSTPLHTYASVAARPKPPTPAEVAHQFPDVALIYGGHVWKEPITREEWQAVEDMVIQSWMNSKEGIKLKIKGTIFLGDCGAVKCFDATTLQHVKKIVSDISIGTKNFTAWGANDTDGLVGCSVFLGKQLAKVNAKEYLTRSFGDNDLEANIVIAKMYEADGGRVVHLRIPKETADKIRKCNSAIWGGLVELKVRFRKDEEKAEEMVAMDGLDKITITPATFTGGQGTSSPPPPPVS